MAEGIGLPPPVDTVLPAERRDNESAAEREGWEGAGKRLPAAPPPPPPRDIGDVVFLMGVPQADVTPAVQSALTNIMAEFDRIRIERDRLRDQVVYLTEIADAHAFLPVVNRRALQREMTRILSRLAQSGVGAAFLYIGFTNLRELLVHEGRVAADAALVKAVHLVRQHIRASDLLGEMGTGDLGLILVPIDPETAVLKAREIVDAIDGQTAEKGGGALGLRAVWGLRHLMPGDEPRRVFADAAAACQTASI